MAGDCFQTAYVLGCGIPQGEGLDPIPDAPLRLPGLRVVHGLPLGRGPKIGGLRYWHAWIEATMPKGVIVIDYSNGLETILDRAAYYDLGKVENVWRYKSAEAKKHYRRSGHCGPWVPGWREMEDPEAAALVLAEASS